MTWYTSWDEEAGFSWMLFLDVYTSDRKLFSGCALAYIMTIKQWE